MLACSPYTIIWRYELSKMQSSYGGLEGYSQPDWTVGTLDKQPSTSIDRDLAIAVDIMVRSP